MVAASGYLFGHVFESVISQVGRYELLVFVALSVVGASAWGIYWFRRRQAGKQHTRLTR